MTAVLKISDGLESVNLLSGPIYLSNWRPAVAAAKGSGVFSDSAMVDGRLLEHVSYENAIEAFELRIATHDQDDAELQKRKINSLLLRAESYWKSRAVSRPIYLEWKATDHTNTVYAPIVIGRWSGLANPFSQPYITPGGKSIENELVLTVERGHWMSNPPGLAGCLSAKTRADLAYSDDGDYVDTMMALGPYSLWKLADFSGVTADNHVDSSLDGTHISSPSLRTRFWDGSTAARYPGGSAAVTNIYSAAFRDAFANSSENNGSIGTICLWIHGDSVSYSINYHYVLKVQLDSDNSIELFSNVTTDDDLRFRLRSGGTNNDLDYLFNVAGDYSEHNDEWILVGMVWGGGALKNECKLYINGRMVAFAFMDRPWTSAGTMNSTNTVIGGEDTTPVQEWRSNISHVAFYGRELSGVEMQSLLATEYKISVPPGTLDAESGCDDFTYMRNSNQVSRLTHIYADGDTSANEVDNAGPIVMNSVSGNDVNYCYFGIAQDSDDEGGLPDDQFTSVALNISNPLAVNTGGAWTEGWEYYSGAAWVSLTTYIENDVDMFAAGEQILTFSPPASWTRTPVGAGAQNNYWIRHFIDTTGFTPNVQSVSWSTWAPYTITKPCIEFRDDTDGDLDSLATHVVRDLFSLDTATASTRVVAGRRSYSRGGAFVSHINMSEYKNPRIIKVRDLVGSGVVFSASSEGVQINHGTTGGTEYVGIQLLKPDEYQGRFRAFLRMYLEDWSTVNYTVQLIMEDFAGSIWSLDLTPVIDLTDSDYQYQWATADMGVIEIPGARSGIYDTFEDINIKIKMSTTGSGTVHFYDLILIPVDEWAIDVIPGRFKGYSRIEMDSVKLITSKGRAVLSAYRTGSVYASVPFRGGAPISAGNERNRMWFLFFTTVIGAERDDVTANPSYWVSYKGEKNKLYLTPRGSG